jgi:hypothetical protein
MDDGSSWAIQKINCSQQQSAQNEKKNTPITIDITIQCSSFTLCNSLPLSGIILIFNIVGAEPCSIFFNKGKYTRNHKSPLNS